MIVVYRAAEPSDLDEIRALFLAENELSPYAAATLDDPQLVAWVALDGGVVVGAILTRVMIAGDGSRRGGIDELLVAGSHRGVGIGRRLMEMAEAHYRERGLAGMQLTVTEDNTRAVRLYETLGYRVSRRRLQMWKDFPPARVDR